MIQFKWLFVFLLAGLNAFSQQDSVRKYLDAELHFTNKKNAVYAAMAIKNNDHWILYAVYPDTSLFLKIFFKDAALTVKDGPFTLYHDKRGFAQTGNFKNNIPDGHWKSWFVSGVLKTEGDLINNYFSGTWKEWYSNGQLMSERQYAYTDSMTGEAVHQGAPDYRFNRVIEELNPEAKLEGPAYAWYQNGQPESVVQYHQDSLTGDCTWFYQNGKPSSKETYTHGKITALACYDSTGMYTGATCSILKLPVFIHPAFTAEDYIEDELHREKRKDIKEEGIAVISFTVSKNGTIDNPVIQESPDDALSKYILRILDTMKAWSPAVVHNRKIDYPVKLSIPYYRN